MCPSGKNFVEYPIGVSNFIVEVEGIMVASFQKVSGISSEIKYDEIHEGGRNSSMVRLFKSVESSTITLTKGVSMSNELWKWYVQTITGGDYKKYDGSTATGAPLKNGTIVLCDNAGNYLKRWDFYNAYPIKYRGPELDAMASNTVAVDTFELVCDFIKMIY